MLAAGLIFRSACCLLTLQSLRSVGKCDLLILGRSPRTVATCNYWPLILMFAKCFVRSRLWCRWTFCTEAMKLFSRATPCFVYAHCGFSEYDRWFGVYRLRLRSRRCGISICVFWMDISMESNTMFRDVWSGFALQPKVILKCLLCFESPISRCGNVLNA